MEHVSVVVLAILLLMSHASAADPPAAVVQKEFIYETAPFASCHASTIAQASEGMVAAWFGGKREGDPSVGIWLSRQLQGKWTAPVEVADGVQADGKRHPCWNPVLFQPSPVGGAAQPLLLFYKVGPSPQRWWGMLKTSMDAGKTWSAAARLPDGILGPVKNKPIQLAGGELLCPTSTESTELRSKWRVHFEITPDLGKTWNRTDPAGYEGDEFNAIQPSILVHPDNRLQAVGRTGARKVFQVWSSDGGKTWGKLSLTDLPNPNAGTDAVTLKDGRHLLVYNNTPRGRTPLNVAVSSDGKTWMPVLELENEPGEYSYPAVIQTAGGQVHITYTWKRQRIRHVVLDPAKIVKP